MTEPSPAAAVPLSRLYLLPALLAVGLGVITLWGHLHQPKYPPAPGLGCIVTQLPSPDTLHIPAAYLELQSCPHISETVFRLELSAPENAYPSWILTATGPEDPRAWARSLRPRWRTMDTVEVGYSGEVKFEDRADSAGNVRVVYAPLSPSLP